jgi:hypothetical protein
VNACTWKPALVTLLDGSQVLSDSEEWRHECEARFILDLPTLALRRNYLHGKRDDRTGEMKGGILQRRGEAAVKRLEATMLAIWRAKKMAEAER